MLRSIDQSHCQSHFMVVYARLTMYAKIPKNICGQTQVKTDIAFLAFFKILDKDEDNSSLGYHCEVKFQGDKI